MMRSSVVIVLLAFICGCPATVGKTGIVQLPSDAAQTCAGYCAQLDLELSAVAIMASNVGCICQPRGADASQTSASAVAGGMTTIMLAEQSQRQQQPPAP
jgi:hypothetical protein